MNLHPESLDCTQPRESRLLISPWPFSGANKPFQFHCNSALLLIKQISIQTLISISSRDATYP